MNFISKILFGFLAPVSGAKLLLSRPKYLVYSIIPFLIGVGFVLVGYLVAAEYLGPFVKAWVESFEFFRQFDFLMNAVSFFLLFVTWILVSIVNFLAGYICISILAGPFYAILVEQIFADELPGIYQFKSLKIAIKMLLLSLMKISIFLFLGLVCFLMAFFPPFNIFASFTILLMVAFDCSDYSYEVNQLTLRKRWAFFRKHFFEYSGFSIAILLVNLVPGAFFVFLPVFICGATKMYIQLSAKAV